MTGSTGSLMVERFPRNKSTKLYSVSSRPSGVPAKARSGLVGWIEPGSSALGWQSPLPQRPEVSPKQATPLPLPNRLRQPGYKVKCPAQNKRNDHRHHFPFARQNMKPIITRQLQNNPLQKDGTLFIWIGEGKRLPELVICDKLGSFAFSQNEDIEVNDVQLEL